MWLRLTERARKAVAFAQNDAKLSPDLVVLACVREEGGLFARVLERLDVDAAALCQKLADISPAEGSESDEIIEASEQEARDLSSPYIGPEHLVLGVLRLGNSESARVLSEAGVSLDRVREAVAATMNSKQ